MANLVVVVAVAVAVVVVVVVVYRFWPSFFSFLAKRTETGRAVQKKRERGHHPQRVSLVGAHCPGVANQKSGAPGTVPVRPARIPGWARSLPQRGRARASEWANGRMGERAGERSVELAVDEL